MLNEWVPRDLLAVLVLGELLGTVVVSDFPWPSELSKARTPHLARPIEVLMIDNFDSFTWNLYQSLCLLGAEVIVIRNDAISPEDFPDLQIKSLVISPGPGHPQTDAGVSQAAITYFMGKIPVLGVCMGLECLVDVLGGEIAYVHVSYHPDLPDAF